LVTQEQTGLAFDIRRPQTFFTVALSAVTAPRPFFEELPPVKSLAAPLVFLLLANLPPAMIAAAKLLGQGWDSALLNLASGLAMSMTRGIAFACVLFVLARYLFKAQLTLLQTIAIVAYASGLGALNFVPDLISTMGGPLLRLFMVAWVLYIINVGLRTLAAMGNGKAILSMLLAVVILGLASAGIYKALGHDFAPPPPPEAAAPAPEAAKP
jgi:hypothetical protein